MIEAVLTAVIAVTAIGLLCAVVLVVAAIVMHVKENEKEQKIRDVLPGANCGACGYAGCDGYAKALANEEGIATNLCTPGADRVSQAIADILGCEFEDTIEMVATVRCCGDCNNTEKKASYSGVNTCAGAKMLFGGDGACTFGCLGYGDCAAICPHGAICMDDGIARIDARKCIGCGLCVKSCPNKLIHMMPDVKREVIACHNKQKGADARSVCKNACIACGKCAKVCPVGAIVVADNLASIKYDKCISCSKCSEVCPVGCIKTADYSGKHRQ
ncbi:MAG: RnfABCDGE type electron transport complex subunit B [Ruminococcaceae bacterium]|nr:RnfABCDGE type electron transport complex subunit B [Oscillospiraceae bacterium]